jgi:hypothetical protein
MGRYPIEINGKEKIGKKYRFNLCSDVKFNDDERSI